MDRTKIDWCDASMNIVTGCYHGCEYCYARDMAHRYAGYNTSHSGNYSYKTRQGTIHELNHPCYIVDEMGFKRKAAYPFDFEPTFFRYKLDAMKRWRRPRSIFMSSMGDLFGDWVPDRWLSQVMDACAAASWHRYLFLTKNPERYNDFFGNVYDYIHAGMDSDHFWFGTTVTGMADMGRVGWLGRFKRDFGAHVFVSIEPLLGALDTMAIRKIVETCDWIIIGAETGNRKDKVIPEYSWVSDIEMQARRAGVPVFMKASLRWIVDVELRREFPWE
jgi:protein gp37